MNCGHSYSNAWKPKHCQKCSFEIGGSYVLKPKKQKLHVPSEKCVVIVVSEDMKISSVELSYRHNRVFVVQDGANFVCHSEKCKEKRAVHMASEAAFACHHTNLVKSHSHPSSAKNLTERIYSVASAITQHVPCCWKLSTSLKNLDMFKFQHVAKGMQCFMGLLRGHQTPLDIAMS